MNQHGIALIIVLWMTALIAIMAGSFAYSMRTETTLTTYAMERSQARALAEAGVAYGVMKVMLAPDPENPWPIEGSPREWRFGRGTTRISIVDSSGKINLNQADHMLLVGLLVSVGVDEQEADALVDKIEDWRDPDDALHLNGAEKNEYLAAGAPVGPKNAPFESIEELQQVLGLEPELYHQLKDLLTVYSNRPGIDPAAASAAVLNAIPDVDTQAVAEYIKLRTESIEQNLPLPPPPDLGPYLSGGRGIAYYISVEAELDTGTKSAVQAIITQARNASQAYTVAAWREVLGAERGAADQASANTDETDTDIGQ